MDKSPKLTKQPNSTEETKEQKLERLRSERMAIQEQIRVLRVEIAELEGQENIKTEEEREEPKTPIEDSSEEIETIETPEKNIPNEIEAETARIEEKIEAAIGKVEQGNDEIIIEKLTEFQSQIKDEKDKKRIGELLVKIGKTAGKLLRRKLVKYFFLPVSIIASAVLSYHTPDEYWEMWQNWKERHIEKIDADDPNIMGIGALYNDSTSIERTTYDFIGSDTIDYKFGYYMTSVFDLTDRTPPKFKLINDREYYSRIDSVAGITTNLFNNFYPKNEFVPRMSGHLNKSPEEILEIPVIGYNPTTRLMRAGHFKEFNEDWLVSETYEVPLNFELNEDGTINLTYPHSTLRMTPLTTREDGLQIPFPIGITRDKTITKFNPYEATSFGVLEGGKVIMVCGEKQLQVNGSFADMFRVYERLQQEYPGTPINAYYLDNGSYNLPIWNRDDVITPQEIREHMLRNKGGGTALVLMNDGAISPYEYRNKYPEIQHIIEGATLDSITGEKAMNEKSVIVIHHTGNYRNPMQIVREFSDTTLQRSAHVLILKDGTRHLFNSDDDVLGHAGKSDFNDRDKVNFFSLGIEMEGDSNHGHQFTIAQIESMIEYMRPRIEKYGIPLENITTHKIIRDSYLRKHPEMRNEVPRKIDLDDKVWRELQDLIQQTLYPVAKEETELTSDTTNLVGTIAYQDAYRITGNKDRAMAVVREMLTSFKVPVTTIKKTENWIRDFA
ncbi:hypothetical protein COU49_01350 [Candidatus Nomurabacteria bacterium CG10_big_fil_rev_8_21_14_0_10_35_16]|uniref:1,6-anhydro-N-acetylmuramyl-L-alanine amidase AmpD n=1 Tax=Candidatus Nomurabacteria bacterium CG10_big_fil_rev_8_21_14_0_10_35_16 TaxID=1974731 RepID=A0A2H0TDJ8_9BACT|nr:MAG: hypothetical protein COU49_01350 [Candidatus Nomurabacteria bacterium CG10_big_fil_rev_8_21_14_0_10_35_16]